MKHYSTVTRVAEATAPENANLASPEPFPLGTRNGAGSPAAPTDTVISVRGLRKSYDQRDAVRGISFDVRRGEIFGFLGPNGAGKTTTIEILEGYRRRTAGEVQVLGVDPAKPTRGWRERIGLVLQECELDPNLTVRETVTLFSRFYPAPRPVDETIDLVGLGEARNARVGKLSGGQRRRVDVALGIVGDPELIFLDEPITGFDPSARRAAWSMIEDLRSLGKTVFLTTHYMDGHSISPTESRSCALASWSRTVPSPRSATGYEATSSSTSASRTTPRSTTSPRQPRRARHCLAMS